MKGVYDHARDPALASWGLAARAQDWFHAQVVIELLLKDQAQGKVGPEYKLKVHKNRYVPDWPWFVQWVRKEGS